MVKANKITQDEILREDERLEKIFREKLIKRKHLDIDEKQFRNRLIDFFEIMVSNANTNPKILPMFLKRFPNMLNKLCLSSQYEHLNATKIIQLFLNLLQKYPQELVNNADQIDALVKTIFNILIYKKVKNFIPELQKIISYLLSTKNTKIERVIEKNLGILTAYLDKGKDIDKIFFSFKKILGQSLFCFHARIEELLFIYTKTKNSFYLEHFVKFLNEMFTSKAFKGHEGVLNGKSSKAQNLSNLQTYLGFFEKYANTISDNLEAKENAQNGTEQKKKKKKTKEQWAKLSELFLAHTQHQANTDLAGFLAKMKIQNNVVNDQYEDLINL